MYSLALLAPLGYSEQFSYFWRMDCCRILVQRKLPIIVMLIIIPCNSSSSP